MARPRREATVPAALAAVAFALAFVQRPGLATADTKINLHVDPVRFLADVASMWTSTGSLGDVQTGQQAGYLFPMGPFFALGHTLGLPDWIVQRLWLGALLALAAWGVARLVRALAGRAGAAGELTAGLVALCNPFVVTYANRTTVTLLAYAALPWLLLAVHRGLRDCRGWRWPAAFALLVTASGGGINGAVTAWMLLGPALLGIYELALGLVGWAAVRIFLRRMVPLTALASLWWVIPAYVQTSYGINFLHFTEQPGTVWGTTSATESLRLMSFWLSYVGIGFTGHAIPYFDDSHILLFSIPVVLATLLLPAAALSGFQWTRRWRYGPFFLLLALVAVLVMMAGFPEGTPLRHGLHFTYDHLSVVQFLRASYKAAPLLALALACLSGAAVAEAIARYRSPVLRAAGAIAGLAVLIGAGWPLVTGSAQDRQVSYHRIPAAWTAVADDLDRRLPANARAIVLPGDLFSFYDWGGTVDPILPALTRRPVAERAEVPYADLRATDLLWTIDALVHQQRLLPGQLAPLLSLIGVRAVVTGADDDLARSDAPPPADAAAQLAAQPGFARPTRSYGPVATYEPTGLGPAVRLPEVRRYDLPAARGLVRVQPRADPTVVDGSAAGIAGLAAFGGLAAQGTVLYAADQTPAGLRSALRGGGRLVVTDSDRRSAFVAGSLEQNTGPVLTASQDVSADGLILDPFAEGTGDETVAQYGGGITSVQAPASPQLPQFPEHAPFAALDGSPQTAWLADPTLAPAQRWLQVDFPHPRAVSSVALSPYDDAGAQVRQVQIAGRTFAVHPGLNRLALGLRAVSSLRVTLTGVTAPAPGAIAGAGGISELRIPGVRATEQLRLPIDATAALSGAPGLRSVGLAYVFARQTGDDPFQRDLAVGPFSARDVARPGDAEQEMRRVFEVPAARTFSATAWVEPFSSTADDELDRLAGYRGSLRVTSSGRFDGEPRWRGSSALDGDRATAWIANWSGPGSAWLRVRAPAPIRIARLALRAPAIAVARPTRVALRWPGGSSGPLAVGPAGAVLLPRPVRTRSLELDVLSVRVASDATAAQRRAVGIAEITGLPRVSTAVRPRFSAPCGSVRIRIGGASVGLRVSGSAAAFADGTPLPARSCGRGAALGVGAQLLAVAPGPFAVDALELSGPAPAPAPRALAAPASGRVIDVGTMGRGSFDHVVVSVSAPSWLVLGESYDRGWQAFCNGRSLGAPVPIDGYANGWRVKPGCRQVRFAFAANRLALIGYVISALAGLACLLLVIGARWRRRRGSEPVRAAEPEPVRAAEPEAVPATEPEAIAGFPDAAAPRRWAPARALLAAVALGAGFAFLFGLRPGVAAIAVIAVILWRGIGARALSASAGVLLAVVVPVLYLVHPGATGGGNHFGYAMAHLGAHYAGVAALGLLTAALVRTLTGARPGRSPSTGQSSARGRGWRSARAARGS